MKACSLTDIGHKREINQDYFFVSEEPVGRLPNLFLVADGMGGHNAGEFASRRAVETIVSFVRASREGEVTDILTDSIARANDALRDHAAEHPEMQGMGTTIVAAVLREGSLTTLNVGDSRLYLIGDQIRQITDDHSLVQEMVRMGEIDEDRARTHPDKNIITRAVGVDPSVEPDIFRTDLEPGERVLLCSDGLSNMIEDKKILQILSGSGDIRSQIGQLVKIANENGGKDNITAILIDPEFER